MMSQVRRGGIFLVLGLALLVGAAELLPAGVAEAAYHRERGVRGRQFLDSRYHHDRYYPSRGSFVRVLPPGPRAVYYGGTRYYFSGGVWYRPSGWGFAVVAPPVGIVVPFLPPFYTTIWVGGIPYYYANDVYYTPSGDGYAVVAPPPGEAEAVPPVAGELFIYPTQGQTEQQQADDRYECHRWAVGQTGYDPTEPPEPGATGAQQAQKHADYQRAMGACLEGRGYTVK